MRTINQTAVTMNHAVYSVYLKIVVRNPEYHIVQS